MRYSIGSISKQFTAASMLLLQEDGKLSLDDPVGKYVPNLTRANEVTIRQLLSHTSGYQDYWQQDYVPPFMVQAITSEKILDMWARKPLDFDPGTRWQYSNTNYVIAGVIIEKVSAMPLLQFLQTRVFTPLGMKSVANIDQEKLGDTDATGYMRYALGSSAARAQRRQRLAVRRRGVSHAGCGSRALGHLDHGPEAAEASFLPGTGDGGAPEERAGHAVRFGS
jgi:CubicO group peptidase (beta-lactamase class C family)